MKKFILLFIALISITFCCSCGAKNNFEDYSVTDDGVFKWNKIKEANYYYLEIGGEELWSEKNKIDLSNYIENGDVKTISVRAFASKTLMGILEVNNLEVSVYNVNNIFYCSEEDIPTYGVTIHYNMKKPTQSVFEHGYKIDISKYIKDGYELEGVYSEGNAIDEYKLDLVNGYFYPTADMRIYINTTNKIGEINIYVVKDGKPAFYMTDTYKCATYVDVNALAPTLNGYSLYFIGDDSNYYGASSLSNRVYYDEVLYIFYHYHKDTD